MYINQGKNREWWKDEKVKFLGVFVLVFLVTFIALDLVGFVPDEISDNGDSVLNDLKLQTLENVAQNSETPATTTTPSKVQGEAPKHIYAPNVDIDIAVENPTSKDNAVLNEYLTKGTVHYPGSADLGAGNTLIFGHSSNLSVVHNQAYKALNGVKDLTRGDKIYVDGTDHRYVYTVTKVSMVKAADEYVSFDNSKNMLTLSTCNTLGAHEDRYVAEAILDVKTDLP
jgi:LPXTG-site transpeptidase (sortase) family protein